MSLNVHLHSRPRTIFMKEVILTLRDNTNQTWLICLGNHVPRKETGFKPRDLKMDQDLQVILVSKVCGGSAPEATRRRRTSRTTSTQSSLSSTRDLRSRACASVVAFLQKILAYQCSHFSREYSKFSPREIFFLKTCWILFFQAVRVHTFFRPFVSKGKLWICCHSTVPFQNVY